MVTRFDSATGSIASGDLIVLSHDKFFGFKDFLSQIVRIFTRSEYSHIGIATIIFGRIFIIESVDPLVRIYPLSNLQDAGIYHISVGVDLCEEERNFLLSKVGVARYSIPQAILAFFGKLKINQDNFFECAELVIASRAISGVDLGEVATPRAIVRHAMERGMQIRYIKG